MVHIGDAITKAASRIEGNVVRYEFNESSTYFVPLDYLVSSATSKEKLMSIQAVTVVADSWAKKSVVRNVALVLGLTGFTALCAQISIPLPFTPVPLTLQTFAILAGAVALGEARAVVAQITYLALALIGLPVLAPTPDGSHITGAAVLGMPTLGYVIGFIFASWAVGKISERGASRHIASTALAFIIGTAIIYLAGATWLAHTFSMSPSLAFEKGVQPFLVGDVIKALVAGLAVPSLWKLVK